MRRWPALSPIIQIAVSISKDELGAVDEAVKHARINRSEFIRRALRKYLADRDSNQTGDAADELPKRS